MDVQRKSDMDTKRKVLKEDRDQKEMERFREQFGGGPEAERLANTLKKLKLAYQEGRDMMRRRASAWDDNISDAGTSDM